MNMKAVVEDLNQIGKESNSRIGVLVKRTGRKEIEILRTKVNPTRHQIVLQKVTQRYGRITILG